ncbi:hypothetical protein DMB66_41150 [Actinoplanes sp. ATCC 53533]|uniref:hypothetical protein n=1 Tax=Actinoplanes sp. ATCC 53533 TaxID=1288362 RepID=UPI000F773007|nr:hypothetical protein [Actinoplanes sp. ATCC 53533]RSM51731.1 hypothetical protein DMB66_41150 [Actinoplanes sp. ATCC 53533]
MRFSPRSIFFSVVALGLPFAVTVGWTVGTPAPAPPPVSAPGGAGGIGAAPARGATPATPSVLDWSPRSPKPVAVAVAVESALPGIPGATRPSTAPSSTPPSAIAGSGEPEPGLTLLPPVPTPTSIITTPPSPSATAPSASVEPDTSGLGAARLVRGS